MTAGRPRAAALIRRTFIAAGALSVLALSCKVDKDAFHERLYSCNPNAANPACGTDVDDRPLACVPAYQLGGRNFCAAGCDVATEAADTPAAVCLPSGPRSAGPVSGARLPRCNPAQSNSCNHEELTCLRTDLIADEGVCMTVNACHSDGDCRDPVRAKCMGELLRQTYGEKSQLKADHTYCLQEGCRARRTACSPGETCLRDILPRTSFPPDICVPNCDANGNCPPNYFCYPEVYSKGVPAICIPGLLGLRCRSRLDCMFGDCVENAGLAYKVCSTTCASDADCARFDSEQGTFFCNDRGYCVGARAYRGAFCNTSNDCLYPGETCARLTITTALGVCLQGCPAGGRCDSFGGVPHACRPQVDAAGNLALTDPRWVCWPGSFAQLCADDSQCLRGLLCKSIGPTPAAKICTVDCTSDSDCTGNRFTAEGHCDPALGLCRAPLADGQPCDRALQCESKKCTGATEGLQRCAETPEF
jgi:hypothetical protein